MQTLQAPYPWVWNLARNQFVVPARGQSSAPANMDHRLIATLGEVECFFE